MVREKTILMKEIFSTKSRSTYLFLIGGVFFSISLWVASLYPGEGNYEISIYQAYPLLFWIFFALAMSSGFGILFNEILNPQNTNKWLLGVLLVGGGNLFLISIPYLRDYAFSSQFDSVVHASRIASIQKFGHPSLANFYPIAHVFTASFALLSRLDAIRATIIAPIFFYIFFLANLLFLSTKFSSKKYLVILAATLGLPLVIGTYPATFRPFLLALYTIPFFLIFFLVFSKHYKVFE